MSTVDDRNGYWASASSVTVKMHVTMAQYGMILGTTVRFIK